MLPGDLDLEWLGPFPVMGEYEHGRARCQCAGHVDVVSEGAVVGPGRLVPGRLVCREGGMEQASTLGVDERPCGPERQREWPRTP